MNFAVLKTLLDTAPDQEASDQELADWCNTAGVDVVAETFIDTRSLMAGLGPEMADEILSALEDAASALLLPNKVVQRTLALLEPSNGGIDVGHEATRAQIDALVSATVLTSQQGDVLKALAEKTISPADNAGLGWIRVGDVIKARALS